MWRCDAQCQIAVVVAAVEILLVVIETSNMMIRAGGISRRNSAADACEICTTLRLNKGNEMTPKLIVAMILLCAASVPMTTCSCVFGPTPMVKAKASYGLVALALCESVESDTVKGNGRLRSYKGETACLKARMCIVVNVKGAKKFARIDVITEVGKGSCGVDLQVGRTYYIAGDVLTSSERIWTTGDDERYYFIHRCSGSRVATSDVIDTLITISR